MNKIPLLLICTLLYISNAKASGGDHDQSGLEEISNITFKTSGTLNVLTMICAALFVLLST